MKPKKTKKKPLSTDQRIKILINYKNNQIIDALILENKCKHQWIPHEHGFKCENCDYFTGYDKRLNQLINKSLKKQ